MNPGTKSLIQELFYRLGVNCLADLEPLDDDGREECDEWEVTETIEDVEERELVEVRNEAQVSHVRRLPSDPSTKVAVFLPGLRRYRKRIPISAPVEVVQTCDAGACNTCARQFGWRRRGHICCSPRSKSQTIDHCHVHAQADGLGSSAWIGAPAIAVLRSDVRAACVRAHAALSTCPKEQTE